MIYIYIILVIFLFGMLIALHELGHFITAKKSGVRVNEFSIGMGPAIWKKQKGETLYALRIIPLGGYCAMEGEDGESEDTEGSFQTKPILSRIIIIAAGSVMNLIVGVLILAIAFAPIKAWTSTTLQGVAEHIEGLQAGDKIIKVDDYKIHLINDFMLQLERSETKPEYDITVVRNGEKILLEDVLLEQREVEIDGEKKLQYGLSFELEKTSFVNKTKYIFQNAYNLVRLVKVSLVDLITGRAGVKDLSGPIGIGSMMVDTAKQSMSSLWYLLALVSINLGIMNLLPIPALDGGRLLFLLIELVRGKPINPKYEGWVHAAGFLLLILLMLFVTFNDILKIFTGG